MQLKEGMVGTQISSLEMSNGFFVKMVFEVKELNDNVIQNINRLAIKGNKYYWKIFIL